MTINFNVEPYYDDYDEDKNFHRILFKPGVAVQARELTQLQTILQKQIERVGKHLFKEGTVVIPGQVSIDLTVSSIKLQATSLDLPTTFSNGNVIVTGATTGVEATVIKGINAEGTDPATLVVRFTKTGSDNTTKVFANNETLNITGVATTVVAAATGAVNSSSIASIQEGVYYVLNNLVKVSSQTIVLDKYTSTPSYRIGLAVSESFITEEDDSTLNDNAIGSYNENAPGAHRYQILLTLDKLSLSSTLDQDFIQLLEVSNGSVKKVVDKTDYSVLEKTLARRTFDESGNYTVTPFRIQIREHRDNNRGTWSSSKANILINDVITYNGNTYISQTAGTTGVTPPTHTIGTASDGSITWRYTSTPIYNRGIYSADSGGQESKLAVGLEPGKAYVQGYEIEKVSTGYIPVSKARTTSTVSNDIISTIVGNYVLVSNIFSNAATTSSFDINSYTSANLYDTFSVVRGQVNISANVVGTAKVRGLEYDSGNAAAATGVFKLSIFDVSMLTGKTFERNVKQIAYPGGSGATFTSDINQNNIQLSGVINASASTTVTGSGTKFTTELVVGDYIYFDSPTAAKARVTAIASDYSLTVESTITATNSSVYRIEALINEAAFQPLLFQLPYNIIKETTGQAYTTSEAIQGTADGTGTLALTGGRTYNASSQRTDYVVINRTTGATENPTISTTSSTVTLTGLGIANAYTVITPVVKSLIAKTKTPTSAVLNITNANVFSAPEISLGKADVFRIDSIRMAGNTINIQDWFSLDDGQKSTHYNVSKLVRNPLYPAPTSNITVAFTYFAHGSGDYFSANSYSTIQYSDVPVFYGDDYVVRLSDVLDFRPRKDDTNANFTGTGASTTQLPRRGYESRFGYSYYEGRKDYLSIDFNGNVFTVSGVTGINPPEPSGAVIGMPLYKLNFAPYTLSTSDPDVTFSFIDNKRYTMRDIAALEKRIENIEYYTALSLLELETKSMSILENGINRFKNGFIVDNFEGHGVGDVSSSDYRCAIDMENNQLRPIFNMENINLIEENNNAASRNTSKYQVTGDLITLRYYNTALVTQQYASRTENINPFAISTFNGQISLTPSSDEWFETLTRPDVIINETDNFDSVKAAAEASGVLGTVWNSWQTQWTGQTTLTTNTLTGKFGTAAADALNQRFGTTTAGHFNNTATRHVTLQVASIRETQSRTGVRTNIIAKTDTRVVDDRVISAATIPYIRARNVTFLARGMRPQARLYSFFDNVNVSSYVTPASKATLTAVSGTFDYLSNSETYDTVAARTPRRVNGDPSMSFNRGDVVYVSRRASTNYTVNDSPGTAVVAFTENSGSGNILHLVNILGSFVAADSIVGTISGASANLSSNVSVSSQGSSLVTNINGDAAGVFAIPNSSSIRFTTGSREFLLTDSSTGGSDYTTRGRAAYSASGVLETKQKTIASTRTAEIVTEAVTDTRVITSTTERVTRDMWFDPLAQTFLVDQKGGCFLTKIDLFFATKDSNLPVTVEIRETINGYPGKRTLPFSKTVLTPSQVNVSSDASSATTVTFQSPVYVQDNTEYCIVLLSDSTNYTVWISQLGEKMVGSDRFISQQPYAGVLFKSQNASTWTADQLQDLKFTLYRAVFDTANTDASVSFLNEKLSTVPLNANPLKITNNSSIVRVLHPNHSMPNGANITLSGYETVLANVALASINKSHTIGNVLLDSYTINIANIASATTLIGGSNIRATRDIAFNGIQPIVQYQNFSDTSIGFTAYTSASTLASTRDATGVNVLANENNYFTTQRSFKSDNNQAGATAADKSFKLAASLSSTNDSLSPVIDLHRVSVISFSNRIDNVSSTTSNFAHDDRIILSGNTKIRFEGNNIVSSDQLVANILATADVGKTLVITGAGITTNNATVVISQVSNTLTGNANISCFYSFATETAGNAITLTIKDNFVDERAPRYTSAASKYLTRQINLANPSQYLRVMFAASVAPESNIDVYYRSGTSDLSTTNWKQMTPTTAIVKTTDATYFTDVTCELDNIPAFTTAAVKLVFRSSNTSAIPRVKDLRVIACP